jgi:hypothetical protein
MGARTEPGGKILDNRRRVDAAFIAGIAAAMGTSALVDHLGCHSKIGLFLVFAVASVVYTVVLMRLLTGWFDAGIQAQYICTACDTIVSVKRRDGWYDPSAESPDPSRDPDRMSRCPACQARLEAQ